MIPSAPSLAAPLGAQVDELSPAWRSVVAGDGVPLAGLCDFVDRRIASGARVYPPRPFSALELLDPGAVKVVILGQDPYHGAGQANGLAFSVPRGVPLPPSLRNIRAELQRDLGPTPAADGDLTPWAAQGVLLLNAVLTVEDGAPASHAGRGWEVVTDRILAAVAATPQPTVFLLWGVHAQRKRALIEEAAGGEGSGCGPRFAILTANHPSPLSARRPPQPFIGCGHFSAANRFLERARVTPIRW